jgi:hypothetical protein
MIQVGQRVRFDALAACKNSVERLRADTVGTVAYVNARHNWFSVQYNENQRISFKFSEIGQNVYLCK